MRPSFAYATKLQPCERQLKSIKMLQPIAHLENIGESTSYKHQLMRFLHGSIGEP